MNDLPARLEAAVRPRFEELSVQHVGASVVDAVGHRAGTGEEVALHAFLPPPGVNAARVAAELREHCALVHERALRTLEVGDREGLVWSASPHHADAVTLRTWLEREGRLPFLEAVRVLREVAEGLVCAHSRGIVHLDLRPELVLWRDTHALVRGFGVRQALLRAGLPPGSTDAEGASADLRALGALAYEVLTGTSPDRGQMSHSPTRLRSQVPPGLARLVVRCLDPEPGRRPASALEALRLLGALVTPAPGYEIPHLTNQAAYLRRRGRLEQADARTARVRRLRGDC